MIHGHIIIVLNYLFLYKIHVIRRKLEYLGFISKKHKSRHRVKLVPANQFGQLLRVDFQKNDVRKLSGVFRQLGRKLSAKIVVRSIPESAKGHHDQSSSSLVCQSLQVVWGLDLVHLVRANRGQWVDGGVFVSEYELFDVFHDVGH